MVLLLFFPFVLFFVSCRVGETFSQGCAGISEASSDGIECFAKSSLNTIEAQVKCSQTFGVNTIVRYNCIIPYISVNAQETQYQQATCGENNLWNNDFQHFRCQIDFGYYQFNEVGGEPLILNGDLVKPINFPWNVVLFHEDDDGAKSYRCGGTLIETNMALTAAHCVVLGYSGNNKISENKLFVALGATSSQYDVISTLHPEVQILNVQHVMVHPDFKGEDGNLLNDLAILKLTSNAKATVTVLPAFLPTDAQGAAIDSRTYSMQINGFGVTSQDSKDPSDKLLGTNVTTNSKKCLQLMRNAVGDNNCFDFNKALQICSMSPYADTGICHGDSGGGAYLLDGPDRRQRWYIQGIVSYCVPPFCTNTSPDATEEVAHIIQSCFRVVTLTKISAYMPWIKTSISSFSTHIPERTMYLSTGTPSESRTTLSPILGPRFDPIAKPEPEPDPEPDPEPPSNSSPFQSYGLERHNFYRNKHGTPSLSLDAQLTAEAQKYARFVATGGYVLQPKYDTTYGQNVFEYSGTISISLKDAVRRAVEQWYSGIGGYNWQQPLSSAPTAFLFTQVVWKSSTKLGIGAAASSGNRIIVIAFYDPAGNVRSDESYRDNVLRTTN